MPHSGRLSRPWPSCTCSAHGWDAPTSLSAVPTSRTSHESLANLGDPDIGQTLGDVAGYGSTKDGQDGDRTASCTAASASLDQRFCILRPMPGAGLGHLRCPRRRIQPRIRPLKQILDRHADDPTNRARFVIQAELTSGPVVTRVNRKPKLTPSRAGPPSSYVDRAVKWCEQNTFAWDRPDVPAGWGVAWDRGHVGAARRQPAVQAGQRRDRRRPARGLAHI